jgi:hypothetical protein
VLLRSQSVEHSAVGGVNVFAASNMRPELEDVLGHAAFFEMEKLVVTA